MVKVLLTGMSGVGKTTVLNKLSQDGHLTVDLDYGWISIDDKTKDYIMDSERMITYIEENREKNIFFAGTTINQKEIYPYVDSVITLKAPLKVMKERIQIRGNNPFGKSKEDWEKIKSDKENFEPLIIQSSDYTVSTDQSIQDVTSEIYSLVGMDEERVEK